MKTSTLLLIAIVLLVALAALIAFTRPKEAAVMAEPTTFEECAALYPVMESSPRQCNTPSGLHFVEQMEAPAPVPPTSQNASIANLIEVSNPSINEKVSSPLSITGRARGQWYFEATFPIEIRNAAGTIIAQHYAEATGEWMTEEFVPFTASLSYPAQPAGSTGSVILRRSNASGDPIRDQELVIPVTF